MRTQTFMKSAIAAAVALSTVTTLATPSLAAARHHHRTPGYDSADPAPVYVNHHRQLAEVPLTETDILARGPCSVRLGDQSPPAIFRHRDVARGAFRSELGRGADWLEAFDDLVHARLERGEREGLLKKRERTRVPAHCLIVFLA